MNRRGFIAAILAAGAAPAIVKAANIMPIFMRREAGGLLVPTRLDVLYGVGRLLTIADITREALAAMHKNLNFVEAINRQYDEGIAGANIVVRRWSA